MTATVNDDPTHPVNNDATHQHRDTVNPLNPRKSPERDTIRKRCRDSGHTAETEGFEPSVPLRGLHLSRVVH